MSSATTVPETYELTGDDAWRTLQETGRGQLLRDAFERMRYADGFSHSRSMAFLLSLLLVQGTIAVVGLASALGSGRLSHGIVTAVHDLAPGPAGRILTQAVRQAQENGQSGRYLALTVGLVGTLVSGTTSMGQLERGLNRMYGIERDRPALQKYGRALGLALTVGVLLSTAFLAVGFGRPIGRAIDSDLLSSLWNWVRWPAAIAMMSGGMALLFRWCPRRRQPAWSWLLFGAGVSMLLWFAITFAMGVVFQASHSFGETYGPLAGIVALQIWCLLSSMGILYGGAVAAQLEAVRAGVPAPRDEQRATVASRSGAATPSPARAGALA